MAWALFLCVFCSQLHIYSNIKNTHWKSYCHFFTFLCFWWLHDRSLLWSRSKYQSFISASVHIMLKSLRTIAQANLWSFSSAITRHPVLFPLWGHILSKQRLFIVAQGVHLYCYVICYVVGVRGPGDRRQVLRIDILFNYAQSIDLKGNKRFHLKTLNTEAHQAV